MNTQQNNRVIAEFMGGKFKEVFWGGKPEQCFYMPDSHISEPVHDFENSLQYHTSWDWLMPVVEKIENLDPNERVTHTYGVEITGNGTTIQPNTWAGKRWMIRVNRRNDRLRCTYDAVVKFIQWYNENK